MTIQNRIVLFAIIILTPLLLIWGFQKKFITYEGQSMGTTFQVKLYSPIWISKAKLINLINSTFNDSSAIFSTWDENSEISKFNSSSDLEFNTSSDFYFLLNLSKTLHNLSSGAYDPTIKPLIDLWGFNNKNSFYSIPTPDKVDSVMNYIGIDLIGLHDSYVSKSDSRVSVDLSSIAKGYAVDLLSNNLKELGIKHFMVELGGEIFVSSPKKSKNVWSIGIVSPNFNFANQSLFATLTLSNQALATSGDYRNYFTKNDVVYSHIFDPRVGKPVSSTLASVSVIAKSCAYADGLATTLMVLGKERGLALVEALDDVEAMIIERKGLDSFVTYYSSQFKSHLE